MKNIWIILLTAALAASLFAGCSGGKKNPPASPGPGSATESATQAEEPTEPEQAETEPKEVSLDTIVNAIKAAYGDDYPADGTIPPDALEAEFGLTEDLYEEVRAEMAMISAQNDRLVVAKAAPGKADELERILKGALQRKIEDTLQYPANIPKTNAAQVVRNGDFMAFILLGSTLEDNNATDAQRKEHAEAEVKKGVDAFNGTFSA